MKQHVCSIAPREAADSRALARQTGSQDKHQRRPQQLLSQLKIAFLLCCASKTDREKAASAGLSGSSSPPSGVL